MVNVGLSPEDIFKAAMEIERMGIVPSAKKIREHLGSGSLTTISKYLNQWHAQRPKDSVIAEVNMQEVLNKVESEVVADFFSNEHPQVIALAFSYLDPKQVAKIVNLFPDKHKEEVLLRMENLGPVKKQVVQTIAKVINDELKNLGDGQGEQKGGSVFVKKIREEMKREEKI